MVRKNVGDTMSKQKTFQPKWAGTCYVCNESHNNLHEITHNDELMLVCSECEHVIHILER